MKHISTCCGHPLIWFDTKKEQSDYFYKLLSMKKTDLKPIKKLELVTDKSPLPWWCNIDEFQTI